MSRMLSIPTSSPTSPFTGSSEPRTWTCLTSSRLRSCSTSRWSEWTPRCEAWAWPRTSSGGQCCWPGPWATPASWLRPQAASPRKPSPPSGWRRQSKLQRIDILFELLTVKVNFFFSSVSYQDFEYKGEKVFRNMDKRHPEITMMKKKFFQSCLKHIMWRNRYRREQG